MFEGCEIYYYNGLFIDKEMFKNFCIQKKDAVGLYLILNNYQNIFMLKDTIPVPIDKNNLLESINLFEQIDKDYFFIEKGKSLLIVPLQVYYGIKSNSGIITMYDNKSVRDAKLISVRKNGLPELFNDISNSSDLIIKYNEQDKLKKVYKFLNNYYNR